MENNKWIDKRKEVNGLIAKLATKKDKNPYRIQKETGLAWHQVKGVLDLNKNFSGETLVAILDSVGVDLVEVLKKELQTK